MASRSLHDRATWRTYGPVTVSGMRETYRSISSLAELVLWRDGGQRQARRNAWASMVTDARRARERAEVAAAVAVVNAEHAGAERGTANRTVTLAR
jgi:hypothetical protein